jgi:hypothetical protein
LRWRGPATGAELLCLAAPQAALVNSRTDKSILSRTMKKTDAILREMVTITVRACLAFCLACCPASRPGSLLLPWSAARLRCCLAGLQQARMQE